MCSGNFEQLLFFGGRRNTFVPEAGGPSERVVIARRMISSCAQVFEFPEDHVLALCVDSAVSIPDVGEVIGQIPKAKNHIDQRGTVFRIDRSL
jgi:hypothetical protein